MLVGITVGVAVAVGYLVAVADGTLVGISVISAAWLQPTSNKMPTIIRKSHLLPIASSPFQEFE